MRIRHAARGPGGDHEPGGAAGRGVAGARDARGRRLVDEFQLPDLWSLHLYDYSAELEVDGIGYAITPGSVRLVPPASLIRYRYEGPSTHLYAHLRTGPAAAGDGRPGRCTWSCIPDPSWR